MSLIQFFKERRIFLFFLFLAFFPTIRILSIGSSASDTPIEYIISAIPELILFVICASYFFRFLRLERQKLHLLDVLIGLYVLYNLIIGFIMAQDVTASLYSVRMTYLPMIMYFLVSFSNFSLDQVEKMLTQIFKLSVYIAILGLIIYFFFPSVQKYFNELITDKGEPKYFIVRMTSILWTPVVFGVMMTAAVVFWHYQYLKEKRNVYLLYIAILFVSVCLSVSRGPIISVLFGVILMTILRKDWKSNALVLGVIIGSFLVVTFYINNPIKFSKWIVFSTQETVALKEGNTRADLVKNTYKLTDNNPLGVGLGKAGHVAVQRFHPSRKDVSFTTTDGWYLKLLLETGYVALIFYFIILIIFVVVSIRYIIKHPFDLIYFVFVFGGVVFLQNWVSNVLDFFFFAYLYWFILGILVLQLKKVKYE